MFRMLHQGCQWVPWVCKISKSGVDQNHHCPLQFSKIHGTVLFEVTTNWCYCIEPWMRGGFCMKPWLYVAVDEGLWPLGRLNMWPSITSPLLHVDHSSTPSFLHSTAKTQPCGLGHVLGRFGWKSFSSGRSIPRAKANVLSLWALQWYLNSAFKAQFFYSTFYHFVKLHSFVLSFLNR